MKIFMVDDEPLVMENLEILLKAYPSVEILLKTTDPLYALEQASLLHPDVIFLDISMPQIDGLTFAQTLQERQLDTKIVFITADADYAVDSYEYNTVDYLLKPATAPRLKRTMAKLEKVLSSSSSEKEAPDETEYKTMALRNDRNYVIDLRQAQYVYVQGRRLLIVVEDTEYLLKNTLTDWVERLEKQGWLQVHRAFIINLAQIESISPMANSVYGVRMKHCSEMIPVSRSFITKFRQMMHL